VPCILAHRDVQSDHIGDLSEKADVNKRMNNPGIPPDADSYVPGLRNHSEIQTSKNLPQTYVMDSSYNQQEQCFAATDTEPQSVNQINIEYIKVEADPLQIENYTSSAVNTVQVFSDSIKCETIAKELVSDQLSSHTKCDYSTHVNTVSSAHDTATQITQYTNNKDTANKTLTPTDNFTNKCNEISASEEGESNTEEVQDSTTAQFQGGIRNTAASSEPGSQRYFFVVMLKKTLRIIFCSILQFCEHLYTFVIHT
jgi:hypothetical protein